MSNYSLFFVENGDEYLFSLSVAGNIFDHNTYKHIGGAFDDDIASISILKSLKGYLRFRIAYPESEEFCTMDVDACFKEAQVQLPNDERHHFFCLNNCLMLLYVFATSNLDTLLIHASVIKNDEQGFVFLGKSGTGKSTHSRLWLEHVESNELLNDDNPVIRIIDSKAYVFGYAVEW